MAVIFTCPSLVPHLSLRLSSLEERHDLVVLVVATPGQALLEVDHVGLQRQDGVGHVVPPVILDPEMGFVLNLNPLINSFI